MESNEAFENWIHNNGSKSMLFINESAALKDKKPKDDFVPVTEKNNLIDKYKELLSKIPENTQNPGEKNIRNYLEKEYEELLQKDRLFKHEYTEFTKSLNLNETFYSQLKEGEMKLSENPEKAETNTN